MLLGDISLGFGDASSCSAMAAEHFSMAAGTDIRPLLEGLPNDRCQAPHWGYLIEGQLTVTYQDGSQEAATAGDLFYWPPGHTIRAEQDTEFVLFSPQDEHDAVMDQVNSKLG